MASFNKGPVPAAYTPFGKNEFLRSTQDVKYEHYTVARETVPEKTIDGSVQKILQPGTVMAKITSGPHIGKIGPFRAAGTAEVQTLTKAGTISGGTFTLTFGGETTAAIAHDANAAAVAAALNALSTVFDAGGVTVTGGPFTGSTPFTVTFGDGGNRAALTATTTELTGAGAGITIAEGTAGVAGATDGRQTLANIVGINGTFLPWQLLERDVEVAVAVEARVVQAWCIELDASGAEIALTNTTAAGLVAQKSLSILFA